MVRVLREREIKQNNREIKELRERVTKKTTEMERCKIAIKLAKDERDDLEFYMSNIKKELETISGDSNDIAELKLQLAKYNKKHAELEDVIFENESDMNILDEEIDEAQEIIHALRTENAI